MCCVVEVQKGKYMKKVILTVGLPASGKTTWAHTVMDDMPGAYKTVCKDDIRAMLDNSKYSGPNEAFVIKVRDQIILMALEEGKHVIVADTNLNPVHRIHIEQLVKGKAEVTIQDFTHVSVEECIKRDLNRLHSVGEKVIREQYSKWLAVKHEPIPEDPALPYAIIVDIDGTLALHNGRSPYDWSKCSEDKLNVPVARAIRAVFMGIDAPINVLIVSGRDESARSDTLYWLTKNDIPFTDMFMRPEGDKRKDVIIKQEIYEREIKGKYNVLFVFDDRNQVVNYWRSLGLTVFQVAEGNF